MFILKIRINVEKSEYKSALKKLVITNRGRGYGIDF